MLKYLCRLIVPLSLGVLQAEKPKESKTTTECTIKDFGIEKNVNIRNRLSTSQPPTKHFYATLLHVEEYTCITFYILFVIHNELRYYKWNGSYYSRQSLWNISIIKQIDFGTSSKWLISTFWDYFYIF